MNQPLRYIQDSSIQELAEFVRIPSVSSDKKRAGEVRKCAEWLVSKLRRIGFRSVKLIRTANHPIVYSEWLLAPNKPTVLIYGHYDVQPAEPEEEWKYPPFAGVIRDGYLHGRGTSDDKGQLFSHIKAIETLLKTKGKLPVNVKCIFEGEEEIGSPNLLPFIKCNQNVLKADVAVMSDTRMLEPDQPALTYALRGQLAMEMLVRGPDHDLHSGNFGGAIHDPLQALCEIIAQFHDAQGHIAIPNFYKRVRPLTKSERSYLSKTGPSDEAILKESGAEKSWGESGFSNYEKLTLRPSLSITGFRGGHGGDGPRGVIPCKAMAKLSFRLVPDQEPHEIERLVRQFINRMAPPTVKVSIKTQISLPPVILDRKHPAMGAAIRAYKRIFNKTPVWLRSGGSIPVVNEFQKTLGLTTVLMGFASPGDNLHGQNERFNLKNFERGILTNIAFLEEYGRGKPVSRKQSSVLTGTYCGY